MNLTKTTITRTVANWLTFESSSEYAAEVQTLLDTFVADQKTDGYVTITPTEDNTKFQFMRNWVDQNAAQEWLDAVKLLTDKYNIQTEFDTIQNLNVQEI